MGLSSPGARTGRAFFDRDPRIVAPDLLGRVLGHAGVAGRIVEVEAYAGEEDPASHAFRGRTERNATMFGAPGHLYVYFTYGMHWCANVVCGPVGRAGAVLIRALAPIAGIDAMYARRLVARRDRDLCSGPAKLCQALGIDGSFDGMDLCGANAPVGLFDDGSSERSAVSATRRIGLSKAIEHEWRWIVAGDPNLSRSAPP
jgi:DNA-3-methyladenine glycosylase